jgi:aspartyl-tRNA(Asn)/glutamyl-tRNA(Gln) amidotransferase subunit B
MRVDVNISVRKKDPRIEVRGKPVPLGTRVEVKNINSFGAIRRAIDHEYTRQVELYDKGESFTQETR